MTNSYVILTGSKNNAGDFLIKHRAKKLFAELRPDRDIIDMDGWKPFNDQSLEIVNSAKALILMGGPALQAHMYPRIYPLVSDLSQILTPITTMGIGWKSIRGEWSDTVNYPLQKSTKYLLDKVAMSGLPCSVRDFHTLNVMNHHGINNAVMTGCPAYYSMEHLGEPVDENLHPEKVAFSLGVSFVNSKPMEKAMKSQIIELKSLFSDVNFEVVFHHGLDPNVFLETHGASKHHNDRHIDFANWLTEQSIDYVDISGSAESLIDYYQNVDLHIGYRVHAHIFMNSISRMSIMISEDGRGKATERVIGGMVVDSFEFFRTSFSSKVMNRMFSAYSRYVPNSFVTSDLIKMLEYETSSERHRGRLSRQAIDFNFSVMKKFICSLP